MAVDFPQSPQEGDQFISGNIIYVYENNKWVGINNSSINTLRGEAGATGPAGPGGATGVTGATGSQGPAGPDGGNAGTLLGFSDYYRAGQLDLSTRGDLKVGRKSITFGTGSDESPSTVMSKLRWGGVDVVWDNSGSVKFRDMSLTDRVTIFSNNGNMTITGTLSENSDITLKKDIVVIGDALSKVSALRGVTYDRTDIETPRQTGLIAQEVEAVLPEAVTETVDGTKAVQYGNLVGLLVEAVKELRAEVAELRSGL